MKSGESNDKEFCFKSGTGQSECEAIATKENSLLKREQILEDMKVLNMSRKMKETEVVNAKEASKNIEEAQEKVKLLIEAKRKLTREAVDCEVVLKTMDDIEKAAEINDTKRINENAEKVIGLDVISCSDELKMALSENLDILEATKRSVDEMITALEIQIRLLAKELETLDEELKETEKFLEETYSVDLEEETITKLDPSQEIPVVLSSDERIIIDFETQTEEIPLALDFPIIELPWQISVPAIMSV